MKGKLFLGLFVAIAMFFVSCDSDDDAPFLGANVKVNVENWASINQDGVTVYMFNKEVNVSTNKNDAKMQKVTDANGMAEFSIDLTKFNIIENETTVYFAVFYTIGGTDFVANTRGITVERNKSYNLDLNIPI